MIHYTVTQAALYAKDRVRVNCIAPGSIEFPGGVWDRRKTDNPALYNATLASIPFGRMGHARGGRQRGAVPRLAVGVVGDRPGDRRGGRAGAIAERREGGGTIDADTRQHPVAFPLLRVPTAAFYWLLGLLLTILILPAPIGLGLMEFGKFLLAPFGQAMVSKTELKVEQNPAWQTYSTIIMILYIPFGLVFVVLNAIQVFLFCLSIIGIPVALVIASRSALSRTRSTRSAFPRPSRTIGATQGQRRSRQVRRSVATVCGPCRRQRLEFLCIEIGELVHS